MRGDDVRWSTLMVGIDTNILVYAHRSSHPLHYDSGALLRQLVSSGKPWLIPWHCIVEFFGVVTRPKVFSPPSTPAQAVAQIENWLECPTLTLGVPRPSYWRWLRDLIPSAQVTGAFVHDAHVAAVCLDYAVTELWTDDAQMRCFRELKVINPLST